MESIGFRVPLLIPVNAIPKAQARKRAHCPDGETEAKLRKVDLCGSKADELRNKYIGILIPGPSLGGKTLGSRNP